MKKKLLLVALFSMLFCLTACNKEVVLPADFDAATCSNQALELTSDILQLDSQMLTIYANDADYYISSEELGLDVEVFKELCSGTITAREEAGNPVSMSGEVSYTVSGINKDVVTITVPVEYETYTVNYEFTYEPNARAAYNPYEPTYNLIQVVVASQKSMAELMQEAGMNTIMGMGIVFIVLIFICFIIYLFKYLPGSGSKLQKKKEAEAKKAAEEKKAEVPTPVATAPAASENLMDDKELVAVITAAVMAASGSAPAITSSDKLVVRSIKRVSR